MKKYTIASILTFAALAAALVLASGEVTSLLSYPVNLIFNHNVHAVSAGRLYRAATLPEEKLRRFLKEKKIKSVIDLRRGEDRANPSERRVVESMGVSYAKVPLNAGTVPGRERILLLLDLFNALPEPILLHCDSGTHRSGVAAALWLMEREGATLKTASEQLSVRYGYFRLERIIKSLMMGVPTIDTLLLDYGNYHAGPQISFRQWAANELPHEPEFADLRREVLPGAPAPIRRFGLPATARSASAHGGAGGDVEFAAEAP